MRLNDLLEHRTTMPFGRHSLSTASAGRAAFVCVMAPEDFIRLTVETDEQYNQIIDETKLGLQDYIEQERDKHYLHPPFLDVEIETGRVRSHEGRHRAAMVIKEGGKTFTCVIYMKEKIQHKVSYTIVHDDTYDEHKFEEYFSTSDEAYAFIDKYGSYSPDQVSLIMDKLNVSKLESMDYLATSFKHDIVGGGKMKGSPDHNDDPWVRMPWRNEHFPQQFVGQFNKSFVVPTSKMRFAPLKSKR